MIANDPVEIAWLTQYQPVARAVTLLSSLLIVVYVVVHVINAPETVFLSSLIPRGVAVAACLSMYVLLGKRSLRSYWPMAMAVVVLSNIAVSLTIFLAIGRPVPVMAASFMQVIAAVTVVSVLRSTVVVTVIGVLLASNLGMWLVHSTTTDFLMANSMLLGTLLMLTLVSVVQYRQFAASLQMSAALEHRANIVHDSDDAIISEDLHGRITSWNPAAEKLFGYTGTEMLGRTTALLMPDSLRDQHAKDLHLVEKGQVVRHQHAVRVTKSGEKKVVSVSMTPLYNSAGDLIGASKIVRDTSEQRRTERELNQRDAMLRLAIETSVTGFWMIDMEGRIRDVNPAALKQSGYMRDELLGMRIFDLEPFESAETRQHRIERCIKEGRAKFESTHRRKDGSLWPAEITVTYSDSGRCFFSFTNDLTEVKRTQLATWHAANHDSLTQLANRALLLDRMGKEIKLAQRQQRPVVALFMDLDGFKAVNDSFGHLAGDQLICEVARRWERCIRVTDTLARIGGDEFALLMCGVTDAQAAVPMAEKLLNALKSSPIVLSDGQSVTIGASIGIAAAAGTSLTPDGLLNEADMAMYEAKTSGKGRYCVYHRPPHPRVAGSSNLRNAGRDRVAVAFGRCPAATHRMGVTAGPCSSGL